MIALTSIASSEMICNIGVSLFSFTRYSDGRACLHSHEIHLLWILQPG